MGCDRDSKDFSSAAVAGRVVTPPRSASGIPDMTTDTVVRHSLQQVQADVNVVVRWYRLKVDRWNCHYFVAGSSQAGWLLEQYGELWKRLTSRSEDRSSMRNVQCPSARVG